MRKRFFYRMIDRRGHALLADAIPRDPVVIDLGAHRGEFVRAMTSQFGGVAHAVEASPFLASRIEPSDRIFVHNYAISSAKGSIDFNIARNPEASSIKHLAEDDLIERVSVPSLTLEELLEQIGCKRPDILKIDIEGAEVEVFSSTSIETLKGIDQITIELHDFCGYIGREDAQGILQTLLDNNFCLIRVPTFVDNYRIGSNINCLFVNKDRIPLSRLNHLCLVVCYSYLRPVLLRLLAEARKFGRQGLAAVLPRRVFDFLASRTRAQAVHPQR